MNISQGKRGILFIISAPSGAGKTTLVKSLCERDPRLAVSVSHTTRPPRPDETQEVSYHFIGEPEFREMIGKNCFLEYAMVFDHHYGTSRTWVEDQLKAGIDVVLEIDWQGADQVRRAKKDSVDIFILPPSIQALEQRLKNRGEDRETVNRRMRDALVELSHYNEYEYIVVNENLERALEELKTIISVTRHKYTLQQAHFDEYVQLLMEQSANFK